MNMMSWTKSAMVVSLVIVSQSAFAERVIKFPKIDAAKGDVVKSAVYDKEAEVVIVEIESNNACNYKEGFLLHRRSGRATFGPHIYELKIGLSTMIHCGQRSTTKIRVPLKKEQAEGVVQFSFGKGKKLTSVEGLERLPKKIMSQSGSGSSTTAPQAPGLQSGVQ